MNQAPGVTKRRGTDNNEYRYLFTASLDIALTGYESLFPSSGAAGTSVVREKKSYANRRAINVKLNQTFVGRKAAKPRWKHVPTFIYLAILSFASLGKYILSRVRIAQVLARGLLHFLPLCLVCMAVLAAPGLRAQSGPPPFVYSANNSADYSTTIAQGSLFVVFGAELGPANLMQFSTFPLPNVLYGTSVTVTSGSTTLNCPMVYTSSNQVAAVLPSNTPVGLAEVAVTYNGIKGTIEPSAPATVVQSSVGTYTTTESGWGTGVFTAPDGSVITLANAAKPGEIVTAWATGLGPINTPDNVLPTSFPNFQNVQVWVGGQSAPVVSAVRSGCCAGVDQISFTMPAAVASGCNIPVTVTSGGTSSNVTTMAVSASSAACTDSGATLPTTLLTKASAGQPIKVAAIVIGPTSIANPTGFGQSAFSQPVSKQKAAAERLSAVLHTQVSESDAARLMRAYAAHDTLGMRMALAKYAPRWNALDTQMKTRLIARISLSAGRVGGIHKPWQRSHSGDDSERAIPCAGYLRDPAIRHSAWAGRSRRGPGRRCFTFPSRSAGLIHLEGNQQGLVPSLVRLVCNRSEYPSWALHD